MQAIILAAGMGRRLGELTKENTKCMVPVNGVRLIDRLLGQLSQLSLNRIIIVVGYKGKELRDYIESAYLSPLTSHHSPLNIEFAENPIYDKTNNIYSLSIVKDKLQEDDTLLIESDLIFSDRLFPMLLDNPYPNLALVAKYESWMDGTMVRLDEDQNIVNFVSKEAFDYADVDSYYKTVNIYKLSREFLQHQSQLLSILWHKVCLSFGKHPSTLANLINLLSSKLCHLRCAACRENLLAKI